MSHSSPSEIDHLTVEWSGVLPVFGIAVMLCLAFRCHMAIAYY